MGATGGISNLKALRGSSSSFAQEESYLTFKTSPPSPKEKPSSSKPRASSPSGVHAELCVWGGGGTHKVALARCQLSFGAFTP